MLYFVEGPEIIYKLNAKIEDALNFVFKAIYGKNRKNRISSDEINTDKLKLLKKKRMIYCIIFGTIQLLKYYYLVLKIC